MLSLQDGMLLSDVQMAFNSVFPYLKLEFFKHPHPVYGANKKKDLLKPGGTLHIKARGAHEPEIIINSDMPVGALEQLFQEHFGLSVQIFRKSGGTWLETTVTGDWSLERQNEQGKELSTFGA
jgi:hypothetical protein